MSEVVSNVEVNEEVAPKQLSAELVIRIFEDGSMEINVPEGSRELQSFEVETITRAVHEQMRDTRIANQAVAMFKSKLG